MDTDIIIKEIKKLSPKSGDIVHMHLDGANVGNFISTCNKIFQWKEETGINALFVFSHPGSEIKISFPDESKMKQYGWVRDQKDR